MNSPFQPFSFTHAAALATIAALTWLLVWRARAMEPHGRRRLEISIASVNLAVWLVVHGWWILPANFDPARSLPLHMCHVMTLLGSIALIAPRRWLATLLYFWGIGLCTQALVTPSLREPPSSPWFWAFWFEHGTLIAIAIYHLTVRGYRPRWRDYGVACIASFAYLAVVLPIDIVFHADYGFVGAPTPRNPSILNLLGPWPQRIPLIVAIVAAVMALLMLPWSFSRRSKAS